MAISDFPYTMVDVLRLEGIPFDSGRRNVRVVCPNCNNKKKVKNLTIDLENEFFNCFSGCGLKGRWATNFYALLHGLSTKEAYENIMNELGLSSTDVHHESRKRIVEEIKEEPQADEVDNAVKDNTYSHLLSALKLSDKHKNDLLNRGFTEEEIALCGYVSYPRANFNGITEDLFRIPKLLLSKNCELYGVPGFYRTKNKNVWTMMKSKGGIMVPYRNFYNQITSIQIRKDNEDLARDPEDGKMESKYFSFSSVSYKDGCKSTARAHYACDFVIDKVSKQQHPLINKGVIAITEGAMKADLAFHISGIPIIGVPGVGSIIPILEENIPLLKNIGVHTIALAYDMDRVTNINVSEYLYKVKQHVIESGLNFQEITWSKDMNALDGTRQMINMDTDFIFTPETLQSAINKTQRNAMGMDFITSTLERCIAIGKKNIYFAFESSDSVSDEGQLLFHTLKKYCTDMGLSCKVVFWVLKLKGIDDYFACNRRNIDYAVK